MRLLIYNGASMNWAGTKADHRAGGFTLVELLVVMAIISILVGIAVPVYLGQRDKAKAVAMESTARSMAIEVQSQIDSYVIQRPIVVAFYSGAEICLEYVSASPANKCASQYPDLGIGGAYESLDDVIVHLERHYNVGMGVLSPYNGSPIFEGSPAPGHVSIINSGARAFSLVAYSDSSAIVYNAPISLR